MQPARQFATGMCLDVHAEIFGFLGANDQANLRRTSKYFSTVFNHAFQRGYVAAAIHEGYVEKVDTMHEDGDDGHPVLRVAPVDPKALFWGAAERLLLPSRQCLDNDATLFVNVRLVLGKEETVLKENLLGGTPFKAVHLYGTETVEWIERNFLYGADLRTFTMTTPCPKLREIGYDWLCSCEKLTHFDISGCCALERVGGGWLYDCAALKSASFKGCRRLRRVGDMWMNCCSNLSSVDLSDLHALEDVGYGWLNSCSSLLSVDFSPCRALRAVGVQWLRACPALKAIDLRGCVALEEVGKEFLMRAPSVQQIFVSKDQKLPANVTKEFEDKLVVVDEKRETEEEEED